VNKEKTISKIQIENLKKEIEKQLNYAKQQFLYWDTKIKQLSGSLAICDTLLEKFENGEDKK